ncbi:hypothetical protein G7K_1152-t1 [Saitoella complicata NRRL Y-17804]|uniref:Cytochrome b561 domain-containing protein n=1 Tax=Saitoella complicata (strain BCRC 22490 / CBS 7301 / JCM 7358 / NBRC 10748 / NRRL Y-17804) TaxID=698492 RepID=A0A0E9NAT3_SAICN|nr:hypothetical protein G7K_1152-t1 [Saitoella complicata NRRL Y-17804]
MLKRGVLCLITGTAAQGAQYTDVFSGICVAAVVPLSSNGSKAIHLQITAPKEVGWVGVGLGDGMLNNPLIVVAEDEHSKVAGSLRWATDHSVPKVYDKANFTLLSSSRLTSTYIVADIEISYLEKALTTNGEQKFVWALGATKPKNITSGSFSRHVTVGDFTLRLPTLDTKPEVTVPYDHNSWRFLVLAHALCMVIAWCIILPLGASIIKLFNEMLPNAFKAHWIQQMCGMVLILLGVSSGVGASRGQQLSFAHQWIGLGLICGLFLQPCLGYWHHRSFVKYKQTHGGNPRPVRMWYTYGHIWLGRTLITVASTVAVATGLNLAGAPLWAIAVWLAVPVLVIPIYAFFAWRKERRARQREIVHGAQFEPIRGFERVPSPFHRDPNIGPQLYARAPTPSEAGSDVGDLGHGYDRGRQPFRDRSGSNASDVYEMQRNQLLAPGESPPGLKPLYLHADRPVSPRPRDRSTSGSPPLYRQ